MVGLKLANVATLTPLEATGSMFIHGCLLFMKIINTVILS